MRVPKKAADRITVGLKKYQPILADAQDRDISESDTVVIIGDMLAEVLGYRKISEITTEFAIRSTYVDLAVKVAEQPRFLVEAKAIGATLKDSHIKQAIDYGANMGIDWVILTNAVDWRVYRVLFQKPIQKTLVFELNVLNANPRDKEVRDALGRLSKEGFTQSSMTEFLQRQQATSRFSIAAVLLSEPVLKAMLRELRRAYSRVKIEPDVLRSVIANDVLKREVVDSEEARSAQSAVRKGLRAAARSSRRPESQKRRAVANPTPDQNRGDAQEFGQPDE